MLLFYTGENGFIIQKSQLKSPAVATSYINTSFLCFISKQ